MIHNNQDHVAYEPTDLWDHLTEEGNFELISKLQYVERQEGGFGTIVVPKEGFSYSDHTHNEVITFLKNHKVNILNPRIEIAKLERSLYGNKYKDPDEEFISGTFE